MAIKDHKGQLIGYTIAAAYSALLVTDISQMLDARKERFALAPQVVNAVERTKTLDSAIGNLQYTLDAPLNRYPSLSEMATLQERYAKINVELKAARNEKEMVLADPQVKKGVDVMNDYSYKKRKVWHLAALPVVGGLFVGLMAYGMRKPEDSRKLVAGVTYEIKRGMHKA